MYKIKTKPTINNKIKKQTKIRGTHIYEDEIQDTELQGVS